MIGNKTDAQYQAEMDAHSLVSAEEVKAAPTRLRRAKVAAKKMAADATKAAKTAKRVAGTTKTTPKTTSRRRR